MTSLKNAKLIAAGKAHDQQKSEAAALPVPALEPQDEAVDASQPPIEPQDGSNNDAQLDPVTEPLENGSEPEAQAPEATQEDGVEQLPQPENQVDENTQKRIRINLVTTPEELVPLPGIGTSRAATILANRGDGYLDGEDLRKRSGLELAESMWTRIISEIDFA